MAIRTKTTSWAFETYRSTQTDAIVYTFGTQTVYVPETTSRTFRSAIVQVSAQDVITATGGTISEWRIGVSVGGAGYTTVSELDAITHSGENLAVVLSADFTAQFTSNFGAGASQTVAVQVYFDQSTGTTLGMTNLTAELHLTYDYDDTVATFAKTVRIPLDTTLGALTTSLAEIGTNQIPILTGASGILKETNIVIRDYYFIVNGNKNTNGNTVTDTALELQVDTDTAYTFALSESALGSDIYYKYIYSRKSAVPTTTSTHAFKARSTALAGFNHPSIILVVTYEYAANSAAATNHVMVPFFVGTQGATAVADQQVIRIPIDIQEPDTIALVQSGIQLFWSESAAATTAMIVSVGGGSTRTYTDATASGSQCGSQAITHRFDSGALGGVGATLARGQSYVDVKIYTGAQRAHFGVSGVLYLNYTSGVASGTNGIAKHNHTILKNIGDTDSLLTTNYREFSSTAMATIADTEYWLQCAGITSILNLNGVTGTPWVMFSMETLATEGTLAVADGWEFLQTWTPAVSAEVGFYPFNFCRADLFKKHPSDPVSYKYDIETARKWRTNSPRVNSSIISAVTYHAITYTATGSVSGYAGTGAVTVKVHDDISGVHLYTFTASVGGSYTATIYDNTRDHFSQVFEDATHVGRSGKWKAT